MIKFHKVRYKNYCVPQEQITGSTKWYLDSDCGRKLTGAAETSATLSAAGTLTSGTAITDTATEIVSAGSNADFVFIKNTGETDILITLNNSDYLIKLSAGEAFASEIHVDANVKVKTSSGTSTVESFIET